MAQYGTAPRKVNGVWVTRSGRKLSAAGQNYWNRRVAKGRFDETGHRARHATITQASEAPKKPDFATLVKVKEGNPEAIRQAKAYQAHVQGAKEAKAAREAKTAAQAPAFESAAQRSAKATRLNPVAEQTIKALSPSTALGEAGKALAKGNVPAAALSAASVFPVGKGARLATGIERGIKAERAAAAAEDAARAAKQARVVKRATKMARSQGRRILVSGRHVQDITPARSRLTKVAIENPADAISRAFPNAPYIGSRARVAKHAGRIEKVEQARGRQSLLEHVHVLPKKGSDEDIAHFWWAQLPASERNVGGLVKVRDRLNRELDDLTGGVKYVSRRRTKKFLAGLEPEARSLAASVARLDKVIAANPKVNERTINAVHALSADRERILGEHGLLAGETAENRKGIVSHYLGLDQSGEEAYIGHRVAKPRGAGGVRSMGLGKAAKPQGLQPNTMKLLRSGGLRQSTHVAAEDWNASQTYQDLKRIRTTLFHMGDKFEGHLPEGHLLVNPQGKAVSATMKHDIVAELGENHPDLPGKVREMLDSFATDRAGWKAMVEKAEKGGYLDQLRVVPEKDVKRFYQQFLPAGQRTGLGKGYDTALDVLANSLIYARPGYVPKNLAQNLILSLPHQGPRLFANAPRAAQLIPHPGSSELDHKLWTAIVHESGAGLSGIAAQETSRKVLGTIPRVVTALADQPARVSAFLHEAANEKVIGKYATHLVDKDKEALLDLLTNEKRRPQLNRIMQRSRDAMADFERLNPAQRRLARRFFIVPGWLTAGTRYPIHFAATHPGRSAALAYVASGEPGAPKGVPRNKPIDEYLVKGLPSYVQGVGAGKNKIERVQSVLPASVPADVATALATGAPLPNVTGYANPLIPFIYNTIAGTTETSSGETKKVGAFNALKQNIRQLAPGEQFVQNLASPRSGGMYEGGRLNTLAREAGVLPVKINKQNAEKSMLYERGMTNSVRVVSDRNDVYAALDAHGYKPDAKLTRAYGLKLDRMKVLDKIHSHHLAYQKAAYQAELEFAAKRGLLPKKEARSMLAAIPKDATEQDFKKWRGWVADHAFADESLIRETKAWLRANPAG